MSRLGRALVLPLLALAVLLAVAAFQVDGSSSANAEIGVVLLIAAAFLALIAACSVFIVSALAKSRSTMRDAERRLG